MSETKMMNEDKKELTIAGNGNVLLNENGGFILANTDMVALQSYLEIGKCLPVTKEEMKERYTHGEDYTEEDLAEFESLRLEYIEIQENAQHFSDVTFPNTVSTASDIYHYGTKAARYLSSLMSIYERYEEGIYDEEMAKKKMSGIVKTLKNDAASYEGHAKTVQEEIRKFIDQIVKSNSDLEVIKTSFSDKFEKNANFNNYEKIMEELRQSIDNLNKDYNKAVIAAATSPSYAWIFPIGTIAGTVVAGVYGSKATAAKAAVKKAEEERDKLCKEHKKQLALLDDSRLAMNAIDSIVKSAKGAEQTLGKIAGIWGSLKDDLSNFQRIVENDIEKADTFLADLGIEFAVESWNGIAQVADAYRKTAYIKVKDKDEILEEYKDIEISYDMTEEDMEKAIAEAGEGNNGK